MKKFLLTAALCSMLLAAIACTASTTIQSVVDEPAVNEVTPTVNELTRSSYYVVQPTATATPRPAPIYGGNILTNGGFERPFVLRPETTEDPSAYPYLHFTPPSWEVWYADRNYLNRQVPALYWGEGNDIGLMFGRPEYKPTDLVSPPYERVYRGAQAAQWFSMFRPTYSGIQQFRWLPNHDEPVRCVARVFFQPWVTDGTTGLESKPAQPDATDGDKLALQVIMAITDGPMLRSGTTIYRMRVFKHPTIEYDTYKAYKMRFELPAGVTRIWFVAGVRTAWPWSTQNFYLDNASLRCENLVY